MQYFCLFWYSVLIVLIVFMPTKLHKFYGKSQNVNLETTLRPGRVTKASIAWRRSGGVSGVWTLEPSSQRWGGRGGRGAFAWKITWCHWAAPGNNLLKQERLQLADASFREMHFPHCTFVRNQWFERLTKGAAFAPQNNLPMWPPYSKTSLWDFRNFWR